MKPLTSLRNFNPRLTGLESSTSGTAGTVPDRHNDGHGQLPPSTLTVSTVAGFCRFPLSSIARASTLVWPSAPGVHSKLHDAAPCAARHVVPPSTDSSTPATMPPPLSVAVPVMTTRSPLPTLLPPAGEPTVATGAMRSEDLPMATSGFDGSAPACSDAGCAPISANRLIVACCIAWSAGYEPRSWLLSRPQAHCTVPAPKTSAPLAC